MDKVKLGKYLRRAIADANPDIDEDFVYHSIGNYHAAKLTALELTNGKVGNYRPALDEIIEASHSPQNFIWRLVNQNVRIPTPDEFYASWENRRQRCEEIYAEDSNINEHDTKEQQ